MKAIQMVGDCGCGGRRGTSSSAYQSSTSLWIRFPRSSLGAMLINLWGICSAEWA
jgi:hypothetical protein